VPTHDDSNILISLRELKDQDPFAPFTIVMTSGDRYLIEIAENFVEMNAEYFYALPGGETFILIRKNQNDGVERGSSGHSKRRRRA